MGAARLILGLLLLAGAAAASAQTMYRWVDKGGQVHYSDTPPPAEVKDVREKKVGAGNYVEVGPSYAARRAQQDFPVTFYRDAECESACKDARKLLERRGIPFSEVVLKSEEDMESFKRSFAVERAQIPALTVGGQKQIGLEDGLWNRLLDDAGYPRAAAPGSPRPPAASPAPSPAAPAPIPAVPAPAPAPVPAPEVPPTYR